MVTKNTTRVSRREGPAVKVGTAFNYNGTYYLVEEIYKGTEARCIEHSTLNKHPNKRDCIYWPVHQIQEHGKIINARTSKREVKQIKDYPVPGCIGSFNPRYCNPVRNYEDCPYMTICKKEKKV